MPVKLCRCQRRLGLLGQALKSGGIVDGEIGEDLAVELDAGFLQAVDEAVVADAVQLGGGADADDPQGTVLALALFASGVSKLEAALDRFFRRTIELGFSEEITACAV